MSIAADLLKQGRTREVWERCCGFIDLNIEQFMDVQHRLLTEQLELLNNCELGDKLLRGARPRTMREFREETPITTYADYAPYLLDKREDILPEKPYLWQRTSGRSGEYPCKWVPVTRRQFDELTDAFMAIFLFASCRDRYEVVIEEGDTLLYGLAPPPYVSGSYLRGVADMGLFEILPPIEPAEAMGFEERIKEGLSLGLDKGIDILPGIPSVLVAIGDRFGQGGGSRNPGALLKRPGTLARLLLAMAKSRFAGRSMLPRDVWSIKALIAGGSDNSIYRERIKQLWGRYPLDTYGCTECVLIGMQTWDYRDMTFLPQFNFLEFMPQEEWTKWLEDRTYQPELLLLDEVQPGEYYALVCTNTRGGPFVRYFLGDVIKITAPRNKELNIRIPQFVFDSRIDGIIDIAGFARLTEKTVWQALENAGLPYRDWSVRKEADAHPVLHVYIEPKQNVTISEAQAVTAIHEELKKLDTNYADLEAILGLNPVRVTVLPWGTFDAYMASQRAAGVDLARLKPPHVNPPDATIDLLVGAAR